MKNLAVPGIILLIFQMNIQAIGLVKLEQRKSLNVFIDCEECDFSFVRQELKFVSFVRNPQQADVHILMSKSNTGSGGKKYYLSFIGLNELSSQDFEYVHVSKQEDTEDDIRNGLFQQIKTGILQYYSKAGFLDQIEINLETINQEKVIDQIEDPWKMWIFQIEAGTEIQLEEKENEYSFDTEFKIKKVTENWKTKIDGEYKTDYESYLENGDVIINQQQSSDFGINYFSVQIFMNSIVHN